MAIPTSVWLTQNSPFSFYHRSESSGRFYISLAQQQRQISIWRVHNVGVVLRTTRKICAVSRFAATFSYATRNWSAM